jgi:hypothetical protein
MSYSTLVVLVLVLVLVAVAVAVTVTVTVTVTATVTVTVTATVTVTIARTERKKEVGAKRSVLGKHPKVTVGGTVTTDAMSAVGTAEWVVE